ncbi:acetyl-CoA carboxylase biotin carboxyl carrier protein subunit [Peribacillus sp. SCS-37]|uniref:acetyl-CoA carboxylase biotin carboxyl carrier protein subunit n=1 Tax=Paraperibacillus esterisolvens TaxID=3115296 RepID=UPI0039066BD9
MAEIKSNMAGSVWKILVSEGEAVTEGQDIIILESMKMEIPISAEQSGTISGLNVSEGDFVNDGDVLATLE